MATNYITQLAYVSSARVLSSSINGGNRYKTVTSLFINWNVIIFIFCFIYLYSYTYITRGRD